MPLDNDFSEWRSFFSFQELPTLFFEFHGSTASVEEMAQRTGEVNFFFFHLFSLHSPRLCRRTGAEDQRGT